MEESFIKMWLRSLIKEEINKEQLTSVAKAIHKPEYVLEKWVKDVDPTPNQSFGVWLLRGLKKQWIRMEDAIRVRQVLERFIQLRRVNRIGDIMQYPHINDLENAIEHLEGIGAKRQGFSGVNPETLPGVEKISKNEETGITFYKVSNPKSLAQMGEGTKWCTRMSYDDTFGTATRYINNYRYLIVGYKNGKPYVQFNPDYSQIMDVNDVHFKPTDPEELKSFPKPNIPKKFKFNISGEEPKDIAAMRRWAQFTGNVPDFPEMPVGFWKTFELKLSKSILNAKSYGGILNGMKAWMKMFNITRSRTPEVEKAILQKDWNDVKMKHFGGGGLMRHIPGIYEITEYVKNIIKGNWPEFEQKIKDDIFNSVIYYIRTDLEPIYTTNPIIKNIILFNKAIKNKNPILTTPEFQESLINFVRKARKEYKYGVWSQIYNFVVLPYSQYTGKDLRKIIRSKD